MNTYETSERDQLVWDLCRRGKSPSEIAALTGINVRAVGRIKARLTPTVVTRRSVRRSPSDVWPGRA